MPSHYPHQCQPICVMPYGVRRPQWVNTLRPRQTGRHFPEDFFKFIFLNENVWISITISLKVIPRDPISNIPALVQIMAWRLPGDKPLSEPMMVRLLMNIYITRPQWVNSISPCTWLNTLGNTWQVEFPLQDIKCVYYVHAGTPSHFHSICLAGYIWSSCIGILKGPCLIIGLPPITALQSEQNGNDAAVFFLKYLSSQLYNLETFKINFNFSQVL